MKIYCLIHVGKPLRDGDSDQLFRAAIDLFRTKKRRKKFKSDDVEGMVTTEEKYSHLGTTMGMEFHATLENPDGTHKVRYIVRTSVLDEGIIPRGKWVHTSSNEMPVETDGLN